MEQKIFSVEFIKNNRIPEDKLKILGFQKLLSTIYMRYNIKSEDRISETFEINDFYSSVFLIKGNHKWSFKGFSYNEITDIKLSFEAGLYYLVSEFKLVNLDSSIKQNLMNILYETEVEIASNPEIVRLII